MPGVSQHEPLDPPALNNFFESNLNFKGFYKISRITARAGIARGIITFGEKDPEATIRQSRMRRYVFWLSHRIFWRLREGT